MSYAAAMLIALILDALLGWPAPLFRRIGHPVTWIGALIAWLDKHLNREIDGDARRSAAGVVALLLIIGIPVTPVLVGLATLPSGWPATVIAGLLAWPLIATRAMHDHVRDVLQPLNLGDLPAARSAVARIVGRDVNQLDEAGIARAGLESLAENTSDGVIAPLFWGLVFGLPGVVAYKAINTADSMIGHRSPRHRAFGWGAARLDDLVNLAPARLTGVFFALISGRPLAATMAMWRDAGIHRSPNAGWPEAAMAAALDVRLSGPRAYQGGITDEPWINPGRPDPSARHLARGLTLFVRLCLASALGLAVLAAI